jgi:hypothetical protein
LISQNEFFDRSRIIAYLIQSYAFGGFDRRLIFFALDEKNQEHEKP